MLNTTITRVVRNPDGILLKILVLASVNWNNQMSGEVIVMRKGDQNGWVRCRTTSGFSREEIRSMSRARYLKEGRPEHLRLAGLPLILGSLQMAFNELKKLMPPGVTLTHVA